jgi:hypothetical protein
MDEGSGPLGAANDQRFVSFSFLDCVLGSPPVGV